MKIVSAGTLPNFRDVSDATLTAGKHDVRVRRGVLFRGPTCSGLTPEARAQLRNRRIRLVVDVRSSPELELYGPSANGLGADVRGVPLLDATWPSPSPQEQLEAFLAARYSETLDNAGAAIAEVAQLLVRCPGPALVHCTAGKDRTGLVVAVLLGAVGVNRVAILDDYRRSAKEMPAVIDLLRRQRAERSGDHSAEFLPEEQRVFVTVSAEALSFALDRLDAQFGSSSAYLRAHGMSDVDLEVLKLLMIERPPDHFPPPANSSPGHHDRTLITSR